ncbi:MAG: hypothetical protein IKJ51_11450 [Clostridia bacterium]|nr:hypothetical protein [Clostridia bacterium]
MSSAIILFCKQIEQKCLCDTMITEAFLLSCLPASSFSYVLAARIDASNGMQCSADGIKKIAASVYSSFTAVLAKAAHSFSYKRTVSSAKTFHVLHI